MSTRTQLRWQFSSRTLILLMLLVSPLFAYIASIKFRSAQYRRALERVRPDFDLQITTDNYQPTLYKQSVSRLIDPDAFSEVLHLHWNGERHVGCDVVPLIPQLGGVRSLRFSKHDLRGIDNVRGAVFWTDAELKQIAQNKSLQSVTLDGKFSAEAIQPLLDLPLYQLLLPDTPLDVNLAQKLLRCKTLSSIGFDLKNSSLEAIQIVAKLPRLSHLTACRAPAAKNIFLPFKACRRLKAVLIYDSNLSPEDGKALANLRLFQLQLIDCQIARGFFRPFTTDGVLPGITIHSKQNTNTFTPHAFSVAIMEERYTTSMMNPSGKQTPPPKQAIRNE